MSATNQLERLCSAVPATTVDAQFRSLSRLQRWGVLAVTAIAAVGVPPLLVDPAAQLPVATALVFIVLPVLSAVITRWNRR